MYIDIYIHVYIYIYNWTHPATPCNTHCNRITRKRLCRRIMATLTGHTLCNTLTRVIKDWQTAILDQKRSKRCVFQSISRHAGNSLSSIFRVLQVHAHVHIYINMMTCKCICIYVHIYVYSIYNPK